MNKKKKIIITAVSAAAAVAVAVSGIAIWKFNSENDNGEKVFVNSVADINTVNMISLSGNCFSGVIESQKSLDVKYDTSKTIKEILVKEGDEVSEGTELFIYDVEAMELDLEQGQLEIEKFDNDIDSMKKQITQLENDKKNASNDDKFSYSTQIQALKTDISKAEYDKKVKNAELEKLKNSIKNSTVKSEMAGTVKKINSLNADGNSPDNMYGENTDADVVMTIIASGDFRVKGTVNEQNMMAVSADMPVIIRSRADDTVTWNGTITEIGSEPVQNNGGIMYGGDSDEMTTSSKYPFYISLESNEGLMLGQHVIIEPDYGQSGLEEKSGIWIYEDYIVTDDNGKTFVWAAGKKDKLEKKYVEIGEKDENYGDCQIVSGLTDKDNIAYPADDYKEGMNTTTDPNEIIPDDENGNSDIDNIDDIGGEDGGFFDENGGIAPQIDDNDNPENIIDGENSEFLPESENFGDDNADVIPAE